MRAVFFLHLGVLWQARIGMKGAHAGNLFASLVAGFSTERGEDEVRADY